MSDNNSTSLTTVIKIPLQRDENGKAVVYIDPTALMEHIKPVEKIVEKPAEKTSEVPKTIKVALPVNTSTPTPEQIFNNASNAILYQDTALKALSTIFYYHLESKQRYAYALQSTATTKEIFECLGYPDDYPVNARTKSPTLYAQAPIFLTGKTGSGKTHMIKQLCKLYDVNFVTVNSSSLSNAGYKGYTLADVGANLLQSANRERAKSEYSVVFFDEFDKLFLDPTQSANLGMYHRSLVTEILTIIEGTTPFPIRDEEGLDSSKMLFILGGSFNMHQADEKAVIGFTAEKQLQKTPDTQLKLTDYGLPDELAGRIGKIIAMQDIDESLMIDILLKSPNSPYIAFREKLAMVDCTVSIRDSALEDLLARQSDAIKKFGVRGIFQGFNEMPQLVDILYDAPNFPKTHYIIKSTGFDFVRNEVVQAKKEELSKQEVLYDDVPF